MFGVLLGLIPMIGWGASDYIASRYSKSLHPVVITTVFGIIGAVPVFLLSIFYGIPEITLVLFTKFAAVISLILIGYISMVKAFSVGATGIVAPIVNAYVILTTLVAVIFLDVELKLIGALAIAVVICGMVMLSYTKETDKKSKNTKKSLIYAGLAFMMFGVGFAGFDVIATDDWYQNAFLFEITNLVLSILIFIAVIRKDRIKTLSSAIKKPLLIFGAIIAGVGTAGLFGSIEVTDNIAIVAAIAAASPLVTALLAWKYDREHLKFMQRLGLFVVVAGIIALALSN